MRVGDCKMALETKAAESALLGLELAETLLDKR
jgi:hypothetical protein